MEKSSDPSEISKILKNENYRLIAVDGVDGSGKSTLASELANYFGYTHINIDDYLLKNRNGYLKYIKYELLERKIQNLDIPIIIEGVCLLAVLQNLGIVPDFLIYIKIITSFGNWRDEEYWNLTEDIDEFISKEKVLLQKFAEVDAAIEGKEFDPKDCNIPGLREEIIRYHYKFKPHKKANVIYKRIVR